MATNSPANIPTGVSGTILRGQGIAAASAFSTSTYPATNAINTLLYASSANVMAALPTANGGVLSTNSSGVPSIDTTNFSVLTTGLQLKGNNTNTAPPAGFIGEQIRAANLVGQALTSTVPFNITSINLTAGVWDVSGVIAYSAGNTGVCTSTLSSISTVSASNGTDGDNAIWGPLPQAMVRGGGVSIPAYRLTVSTTTTVYLVADATITSDTVSAYGRISATRVG